MPPKRFQQLASDELARKLDENVRIYGEGHQVSLPQVGSPVSHAIASTLAVSAATPDTLPRPKSTAPIGVAKAASTPVQPFLMNRDLHGLEPALSIRTRILLACHAMNQMSMCLDEVVDDGDVDGAKC